MSSLVPVPTSGLATTISNALSSPNLIRTSSENLPEIQKAIDILAQSASLKPSAIAKVKGQLYESVQLIDDAFMRAVHDYESRLANASFRDAVIRITMISYPKLYAGGIGAMEIVSKYTPDIPVVEQVCLPILWISGFLWGIYNQEKIVKEKHEKQKSVHRLKWANYVSVSEEKRIEESVALAKRRIRVLAEEVTDFFKKTGLLYDDKIDELSQLSKVIQAISGNDLTVDYSGNQISVSQFITHFQIKEK